MKLLYTRRSGVVDFLILPERPASSETLSMLRIAQPGSALCDGFTRREWLQIGGLGAFGITLPQLLTARASAAPMRRPKSCILLFLLGAPPQHESWDPKPDAPAEIRGDLKPIQSATPGLMVGETMPKTAALTKHIAVLRAMTTNDNAHSSSGYFMTTGHSHVPVGVENAKTGAPNDWPCLGALVKRLSPNSGPLPASITLPSQAANDGNLTWPGQDGGFLGRSSDPWLLNCDPSSPTFEMPGIGLPTEISASRFDERRSLLRSVEARLNQVEHSRELDLYDTKTQQAFDLIRSPAARRAFDLESEPDRVRDRYGRNRFGQSVLLARRMVEAGVPLIRVNWTRVPNTPNNGSWDTHADNTAATKKLMPILDDAYSALLDDLAIRGMLDDTLVVWMGEFGRTPKINPARGRDHWGQVFSIAMAGGGVRGGQVIGASDKIAGYPKDGRQVPQDLMATILHCLGIPPTSEIHDNLGRPLPATRGQVISSLF